MVTVQVALDDRTAEELEQAAQAQSTEPSALAEQAIRAFLHGEAQRAMEREAAAFQQLHPDLAASIPGEYAAIHQGKLVDHDADQLALLARVENAYPGRTVLIRQVRPEAEETITVRSPRFDRG